MIYSKTCEFAIRALVYFVNHPEKSVVSVKEVGRESGVSPSYVAKIFQCLVKSRILVSQRGSLGGYSLAVPAYQLTLLKIIHALDDLKKSPFSNCIMGLDRCGDGNPCPLHAVWAKSKDQMLRRLDACTIVDVAALGGKFKKGRQRKYHLSRQMREIFSVER